jgi:hypothetical protein
MSGVIVAGTALEKITLDMDDWEKCGVGEI